MSQSESSITADSAVQNDRQPSDVLDIDQLIEENGTVPFIGMSGSDRTEYPEDVSLNEARTVDENDPTTFKEALEVLPEAGENELWADNPFVDANDDGVTVDVDLESMRDVHGLDIDTLERRTNMTLEEMVSAADPQALIPVATDKGIIDERRLVLQTLGYNCRFRWQIASSGYNPGNMRAFFRRKIAACQQAGAEDAFGWIRHYDWGGSVTLTTIYPSMAYEVGMPDDTDIDFEQDEIVVANGAGGQEFSELEAEDLDDDTVTVYYGDRLGYDFSGTQTLWAKPVVFIPKYDTMIPIPDTGKELDRRHTENIMDDAIEYHDKVLNKIEGLAGSINQNIIRSRMVALSFDEFDFSIEEFYRLIGIKSKKYRELAAERVRKFAEPETEPTVWNLQLSLKLVLLNEFQGKKAGRQYEAYQQKAGEMLRKPALTVQEAKDNYRFEQEQKPDTDSTTVDDDQSTLDELADSIDDVLDMDGVKENRLDVDESQIIEDRVQSSLPSDEFETEEEADK